MRAYGLALALSVASFGCSTTTEKRDQGPCGFGYDGCIFASVQSNDPTPFDPANPNRDGKGTFYAAIVDACPSGQSSQFQFLSPPATTQVDFTQSQIEHLTIRYKFVDATLGTNLSVGETAYMIGFLDDNGTVTDPRSATVDFGDTFTTCVKITIKSGPSTVTTPMSPCLLLDTPDKLYAFTTNPGQGACDVSFVFPDAGTDGGGLPDGA